MFSMTLGEPLDLGDTSPTMMVGDFQISDLMRADLCVSILFNTYLRIYALEFFHLGILLNKYTTGTSYILIGLTSSVPLSTNGDISSRHHFLLYCHHHHRNHKLHHI
jgi:hypothetical protein